MEKCGAQPRCAAHCRSTVTLNNNLIPLASNPDCAKRSVKGGIRPKKSLATTVPSVPKVSWWKKRIWHCCDTILAWDSDFWQILDSDLSVISLSYQDLALPPSFFGLLPANLWLKETRWQLGQSLQLLKTPQLSVPYLRNAHHIHNYIMLCSKKIQLDVIYLQNIHVLDTPWNQIAVGLETLEKNPKWERSTHQWWYFSATSGSSSHVLSGGGRAPTPLPACTLAIATEFSSCLSNHVGNELETNPLDFCMFHLGGWITSQPKQ